MRTRRTPIVRHRCQHAANHMCLWLPLHAADTQCTSPPFSCSLTAPARCSRRRHPRKVFHARQALRFSASWLMACRSFCMRLRRRFVSVSLRHARSILCLRCFVALRLSTFPQKRRRTCCFIIVALCPSTLRHALRMLTFRLAWLLSAETAARYLCCTYRALARTRSVLRRLWFHIHSSHTCILGRNSGTSMASLSAIFASEYLNQNRKSMCAWSRSMRTLIPTKMALKRSRMRFSFATASLHRLSLAPRSRTGISRAITACRNVEMGLPESAAEHTWYMATAGSCTLAVLSLIRAASMCVSAVYSSE
mmetsp:Transcript_21632/g.73557  ORF Transcript_21632/g.73557 Transcript_21632/m.73557 type:complete len:308 (+) Transcript_21632:372-1295(+)